MTEEFRSRLMNVHLTKKEQLIAEFVLDDHLYREAYHIFKAGSDQVQVAPHDLVPFELGLYLQIDGRTFHFQRFDSFDPRGVRSGIHIFLEFLKNEVQDFL